MSANNPVEARDMFKLVPKSLCLAGCIALVVASALAQPAVDPAARHLELMDVYDLEHASDPQMSPDGERVVYVRNFMDV
ncbi:MAG: hypothetical protein R3178_07515, partial [Rhodothermales bacterium]|nr:hypothetical protein [Rhodothermales bacterium]